MSNRYEFTVFSPCYNSEKFIYRTYESLQNQQFKDFEWLVIEDQSTDQTKEILLEIKKKSDVNINLICNKKNKMLAYNCNLAVQMAQGKFFIFLGHDDELMPEALDRFYNIWKEIPSNKKNNLAGMMSNCKDEQGNFVDDELPDKPLITDFYNLYYNLGIRGEKCFCYLTDIIRQENFSTVDKYVPENVMLLNVSDSYETYFFNENLRIYHRNHGSFTNKLESVAGIKYSKGMRHAKLQDLNRRSHKMLKNPILFFKTLVNFNRFSLHSRISIGRSLVEINTNLLRISLIVCMPIAIIMFLKDIIKLN